MRKVGSGNQGTACLSSLRYARQSNIPDGPSGASGRTKRREERSVPPRGVSHRSYWSAANPFVLVFTAEQRVSSTAAQSRGCNRSRAITWSVKQTSTKTAALFIQNWGNSVSWDSEPIHSPDGQRAPLRWMERVKSALFISEARTNFWVSAAGGRGSGNTDGLTRRWNVIFSAHEIQTYHEFSPRGAQCSLEPPTSQLVIVRSRISIPRWDDRLKSRCFIPLQDTCEGVVESALTASFSLVTGVRDSLSLPPSLPRSLSGLKGNIRGRERSSHLWANRNIATLWAKTGNAFNWQWDLDVH